MRWVLGRWYTLRTAFAEKAFNLLSDGLFVGGAKHACGVDAMLLRKLASAHWNSTLVEDILHRLEDILGARCGGTICLLLTLHHHVHNLAQLDGRQVFRCLDLIDLRFSFASNGFQTGVQFACALVRRTMRLADDRVRLGNAVGLIRSPLKSLAKVLGRDAFLSIGTQ
ncbi:hypothetical protein A5658_18230 [Mycobacterium sp. 1245111.1]|nr:hypothetical protein A5658_18230 [Mycobacterium sp. 1245111.1]